jgi:hypothetical protein
MYARGRTTDTSAMDKIHPGDIVRIEYDGKLGTLSFGVNGKEPEVGFTEVTGTISPACGSYRTGVKVKLLRVEVYQSCNKAQDDDELARAPSIVYWELDHEKMQIRYKDVLAPIRDKRDKKEDFEVTSHRVVTSKTDMGVLKGLHEWSFEVQEQSRSLLAFGVTTGKLEDDKMLASQFNFTVPRWTSAWLSDGSLWSNGIKIADGFGKEHFPLKKLAVVTMRLDLDSKVISFLVNGALVGDAFSWMESSCLKTPEVDSAFYPAASVTSPFQSIRILPTGYDGSVVLPFLVYMQKSATSCYSRMSSALISGPPEDKEELGLLPWLSSPLLIGGLDDQHIKPSSILRKWKHCWNDGQLTSTDKATSHRPDLTRGNSLEISIDEFITNIAEGDLESSSSVCMLFVDWLNEAVDKDTAALRKVLERSNTYRFPRCELPFVAAMVKHGGLFQEAMAAVLDLQAGKQPVPSNDMKSMWKRVRQLRVYLRQQRQLSMGTDDSLSVTDAEASSTTLTGDSEPDAKGNSPVVEALVERFGFYVSADMAWTAQINVTSVLNSENICKVISVGIDSRNELLYVKFSLLETLQPSIDSRVSIGESEDLIDPVVRFDANPGTEITGCLRFDLPHKFNMASLLTSEVGFIFGNRNYSVAILNLHPPNNKSADTSAASLSFQQRCDEIESKSAFLLQLVYAGSGHFSITDHSATTASKGQTTTSTQEGHEKWKKVVEFLRVHTSRKVMSKINSVDSSPFLDEEEDQFSINSALKACALFITHESSPAQLFDVIQRRNLRASARIFAMESISEVLASCDLTLDLNSLQEILVFIKSSLDGAVKTAGIEIKPHRSHYLNGLEGCSANTFRTLQDAFLRVFSLTIDVLQRSVDCCENNQHHLNILGKRGYNVMNTLLTTWTIHFSSRDHKFLLDSGFLKVLYKLNSLGFYEKSVSRFIESSSTLVSFMQTHMSRKDEMTFSKRYLAEGIVSSLENGSLTLRDIILNVYLLPDALMTEEERRSAGVSRDPSELMKSMTPIEVTQLFQKLVLISRAKELEIKKERDLVASRKEKEIKDREDKIAEVYRGTGIPGFNPVKKADEVMVTSERQHAGILSSRTSAHVVGVFTDLCYDLTLGSAESGYNLLLLLLTPVGIFPYSLFHRKLF